MFFSSFSPTSINSCFKFIPHLLIGRAGETEAVRLGDAFELRRDIYAIPHQVAVAFLDHIAEMNANTELDAALGRKAGVTLDHSGLHLDGAPHSIDHAAKFNKDAISGALEDATVMEGGGGIDQVTSECA